MDPADSSVAQIMAALKERAKELNCLYRVDEILSRRGDSAQEAFEELVAVIPDGWQYPEICQARVRLDGAEYRSAGFQESRWHQVSPVLVEGQEVGEIAVHYTEARPQGDEGPFLKEERRLISAIAERIGMYLLQRRLRSAHDSLSAVLEGGERAQASGGAVILDFLRRTDRRLLAGLTRKMINHLYSAGVTEAEELLAEFVRVGDGGAGADNIPVRKQAPYDLASLADRTFELADTFCGEDEVIACIHSWMEEDKVSFMLTPLENPSSGLAEVADMLQRFRASRIQEDALPVPLRQELRVSLLRQLFTESLDFVKVAKEHVRVDDFHELMQRTIFHPRSHGRLGGKTAGLFLADRILASCADEEPDLAAIKVPRTWYVASDCLLEFMHHNNLEELYNRKYIPIEQVRLEYPHVVQLFKNSSFPVEISQGLSMALDDLGEGPLIVRSSSLLEDRSGAAFSGKYKSLFLANQGSKSERLAALEDAIAEVYASTFGPDPIEYRDERGLLDVHEEMGILIQEVVGRRVGNLFFPTFAGVAFSDNEFRWSPRIRREDGLLRLVPGLGTRAVDRLSDDYPVLVAPGQPGLRVNATPEETVRYSPRAMDVIDLETNRFTTVDLGRLLREHGDEIDGIRKVVSLVEPGRLRVPGALEPDWEKDDVAVTFEGLIGDGRFVRRVRRLLEVLRERLGTRVDLEFAHDGTDLYLLQCRAQSYQGSGAPAAIPRNLSREAVVFSAHRHVSNGRIDGITHVVYVDPEAYSSLGSAEQLREVARAVGRLNRVLPRRQFILMGPGRWGSRGDIRLGVSVTYADISNTAALLEIARKKGSYVPELSFGTHFFQDLVEADIRYLPLYPDEPDVRFNEGFFRLTSSILPELLPDLAHLGDVVRVIDVPGTHDGRVLQILMNAELDEAVALLTEPASATEAEGAAGGPGAPAGTLQPPTEEHWRWRLHMAERIAGHLDGERFGVKALYLIGSTKNATAGPGSDIDLLVHWSGDEARRQELDLWLRGWSLSLAEDNYLRTGYRSDGLLDVHFVSDADLERGSSYAVKIGAVTDAARPLHLKTAAS